MGAHVIECAGNSNPQNFGLMSAVEWDGVPLAARARAAAAPAGATARAGQRRRRHDVAASRQSQPGASWVLPLDVLDRLGAVPGRAHERPAAHAPTTARRCGWSVPGWYGCAWIKWVNEIALGRRRRRRPRRRCWSSPSAPIRTACRRWPATTQTPAIDTAAMPVRVEQRRVDGRIEYRVVGIVWGGTRPVDRLVIRFGSRDPRHAVHDLPGAAHPSHLVAVELPLAAGRAGLLRHRPARRRPAGPHPPSRPVLLHPSGPDRRDLTLLPPCPTPSPSSCWSASSPPRRPPRPRTRTTARSGSRPWPSAGSATGAPTSRCSRASSTTPRSSGLVDRPHGDRAGASPRGSPAGLGYAWVPRTQRSGRAARAAASGSNCRSPCRRPPAWTVSSRLRLEQRWLRAVGRHLASPPRPGPGAAPVRRRQPLAVWPPTTS